MMVKTQIQLEAEQHRKARRRAADLGISLSEYFRRLASADLAEDTGRRADVSAIFGLGASGGSDVAMRKHEYVGEAVDREAAGETGHERGG